MRDSLRLVDLVGLDEAIASLPVTARAGEVIRADSFVDSARFEAEFDAPLVDDVALTPTLVSVLAPHSYDDLRSLITYDHEAYARGVLVAAIEGMLDEGIAREDIAEALDVVEVLSWERRYDIDHLS